MTTSFRFVPVLALALASVGSVGCTASVQAEPADVVVESPPPAPAAEVEVVPANTYGADYVWIGGYHRWDGRRYVWVRGRYERRPHAAARWEVAHWEVRGRGHVWVEGRWR